MKQILNLSRQSDVDGADGASVVDPSLCLGSSVKKTAPSLIAWKRDHVLTSPNKVPPSCASSSGFFSSSTGHTGAKLKLRLAVSSSATVKKNAVLASAILLNEIVCTPLIKRYPSVRMMRCVEYIMMKYG